MKLLIIDDEEQTTRYLSKGLREEGFVVDCIHDGVEGLYAAESSQYDLIVLDIMLPRLNGWDVLTAFRQKNKLTPVLLLTARDEVQDRVKGLQLGADDYLVKPFAFSELVARIRTILRRGGTQVQQHVLDIDDLTLDLDSLKATRAGQKLELTQKEFSLLSLFLRNKGRILSRTMISEAVWGINFDSDTNAVDVAIKRLRYKIDDSFDTKLIHTVRGLGYVLEVQ